MRFLLLFVSTSLVMTFAGCGGNVTNATTSGAGAQGSTSSGPGSTSTSTSTTGSGGSGGHGDCTTDADCGGKPCIPLTPGGYTVCQNIPPEATMCHMQGIMDDCCDSSQCMKGACYDSMMLPQCGGALQIMNLCIDDTCMSDADCVKNTAPAICAPAGAFGRPKRQCLDAYCRTDADCVTAPGGVCEPILNACCGIPYGLGCVYPGGCNKDADCSTDGSQHCELQQATGQGVCAPGGTACPG
jgi:hypothetical protein